MSKERTLGFFGKPEVGEKFIWEKTRTRFILLEVKDKENDDACEHCTFNESIHCFNSPFCPPHAYFKPVVTV